MDLIDVKEAAEILDVNLQTVRRYYRQGHLKGHKKGLSLKIWFDKSGVEKFLFTKKSQMETV